MITEKENAAINMNIVTVLAELSALDLPGDAPPDTVLDRVKTEYMEQANCQYLCGSGSSIIMGREYPEMIRNKVLDWNVRIRTEAWKASRTLSEAVAKYMYATDDSFIADKAREASIPIRSLTNQFVPAGNAICNNNPSGWAYWHTTLSPDEKVDITHRPENYAMVQLSIFSHPKKD